MQENKYENAIAIRIFGGAAHPLSKSESCVGVYFANSGKNIVADFGEYVAKDYFGDDVRGVVSAEGLDFLIQKADYLFISHAHEDHINGLFHIFKAGYKINAPIIATPDTLDFLVRTAEKNNINLEEAVVNGFVLIKEGMNLNEPITLNRLNEEINAWKSYDHYEKQTPEYEALYNGIEVDLGGEDKITFFSVSHMLGSVGAFFTAGKIGDSNRTQVLYPADYTFDKEVFFGVPTNPDLMKKFGDMGRTILITDIMWANAHQNEEFNVEKTLLDYQKLFKEAENKPLFMSITPEYNEPLFAFMKAAYLVGRKNVCLHMAPSMEGIVHNLCDAIDVKQKIGEDFKIYFNPKDIPSELAYNERFDVFDRATDNQGENKATLALEIEKGEVNDAILYCSQSEKYPHLVEEARNKGYQIHTMSAIKAHPTNETVEDMICFTKANRIIPIHAPMKDTMLYLESKKERGVGPFELHQTINLLMTSERAMAFQGDNLIDYEALLCANHICFVEDGKNKYALRVPKEMLKNGKGSLKTDVPFIPDAATIAKLRAFEKQR